MNNDLISRSALLEKTIGVVVYDEGGWDCNVRAVPDYVVEKAPAVDAEKLFEQVGLIQTAFEMAKSNLAPAPTWISVKDRLPDSQADVLVVAFWHECWQTMIGWHSDSGKKWRVLTSHGEREPGGVTHWMPLPEPPKEG